MVLLPCLSSTSHSVAILAKLGAPLWPGVGDSSLWHCLGSSPWTCVLLSWAHTLNEAENGQNKQVLFFMHQQDSWGSGAMAKGIRVQECLTVPWESGRERGAQLPGLLRATWQSPISIISRQRHAPFDARGATRQAASRGSILAGF